MRAGLGRIMAEVSLEQEKARISAGDSPSCPFCGREMEASGGDLLPMKYTVHGQHEVTEMATLADAQAVVASEWRGNDAAPTACGFVNPWIMDRDGNEIEYIPSPENVASYD